MGRDEVLGSREVLGIAAIDGALLREAHMDPRNESRIIATIRRVRESAVLLRGLFPNHVECFFVSAKPEEDRMSHLAVRGPLGEFHLAD
jgi:hypothetical protein